MSAPKRAELCPRCGGEMRPVKGSDRTVRGGMWYVKVCPNCLHRADVFVPRRSRKE